MPLPINGTPEEYRVYFAQQAAEGISWKTDISAIIQQKNYVALSVLLDQSLGYITNSDDAEINRIIASKDNKLITALVSSEVVLDKDQLSAIIPLNLEIFGDATPYHATMEGEETINRLIIARYNSNLTKDHLNAIVDTGDVKTISKMLRSDSHPEMTKAVYERAMSGGEFDEKLAEAAWSSVELTDPERKKLIEEAIKAKGTEFLSTILIDMTWNGAPVMANAFDSERVYQNCLQELFDSRTILDSSSSVAMTELLYQSIYYRNDQKAEVLLRSDQVNEAFEEAVKAYAEAKEVQADIGNHRAWKNRHVDVLQDALEIMMRNEGGNAGNNTVLTDDFIVSSLLQPGCEEVALEFARQFILEGRLDMVAQMLNSESASPELKENISKLVVNEGPLLSEIAASISENDRNDKGKEWAADALDPNNGGVVTVSDLVNTIVDGESIFSDAKMDSFQIQSPVQTRWSNTKHTNFKLP